MGEVLAFKPSNRAVSEPHQGTGYSMPLTAPWAYPWMLMSQGIVAVLQMRIFWAQMFIETERARQAFLKGIS